MGYGAPPICSAKKRRISAARAGVCRLRETMRGVERTSRATVLVESSITDAVDVAATPGATAGTGTDVRPTGPSFPISTARYRMGRSVTNCMVRVAVAAADPTGADDDEAPVGRPLAMI